MDNVVVADNNVNTYKHSVVVNVFAKIISVVFHPLFIPLYIAYYIIFVHESYFTGIGEKERMRVLMWVALNMIFFPAFTVLLLKGVGFIDSIYLRTQRNRIIPYIAAGIFYFWMYLVFRNQPDIPQILTAFTFGAFLASSAALVANIYFKISMHAIGCGGMIGVLIVILNTNPSPPFTLPLMIAILITGFVCTARLIVSDHKQGDIYAGLLCGFFCQFISAAFFL